MTAELTTRVLAVPFAALVLASSAAAASPTSKPELFNRRSCTKLLPNATLQALVGVTPTRPVYSVAELKGDGLYCSWTVGAQRQAVQLTILRNATRSMIDAGYAQDVKTGPALTCPAIAGLPKTRCLPPQHVTGIGEVAVWSAPGIGWGSSLGVFRHGMLFALSSSGSTNTVVISLAQAEAAVRHVIAATS